MSRLRDQAVCLRESDWSETSQVVTLLTREHGLVRGLAKGARRTGANFGGGFEMLSAGELIWIPRPHARLATLTSWTPAVTWPALRSSYPHWLGAMYAAELCGAVMREQDPHPEVFIRFLDMLDACAPGDEPLPEVLRTQWVVLCTIGHRLELDRDIITDTPLASSRVVSFLPAKGGFTTREPAAGELTFGVRGTTLDALRAVDRGDVPSSGHEVLGRACALLHEAIRQILGHDLRAWKAFRARVVFWDG